MAKVRKTPLAEADLIDIWTYSYQRWGEDRAERYFDELDAVMRLLRINPELGRRCDELRQGYRALRVDRHVIYYKIVRSTVHVVRVLHQRMDPDLNL